MNNKITTRQQVVLSHGRQTRMRKTDNGTRTPEPTHQGGIASRRHTETRNTVTRKTNAYSLATVTQNDLYRPTGQTLTQGE